MDRKLKEHWCQEKADFCGGYSDDDENVKAMIEIMKREISWHPEGGLVHLDGKTYEAREKLFGDDLFRYFRCDSAYPYSPEEFPFLSVDKADGDGNHWCRSWMRKDGPKNLGKCFTHEEALKWALESKNE